MHPNEQYILANHYFLHHEFKKALDILINPKNITVYTNKDALNLNIALLYQILGNKELAQAYYAKCPDNDIKRVNLLSFYHRFFCYHECKNVVLAGNSIELAFANNLLNYKITTKGLHERNILNATNMYNEQLLNDYYLKVEGKEKTISRNQLSVSLNAITRDLKYKVIKNDKNHIGIYLTDIQRHKNGGYIYDLIDILRALDKKIFIYIDNLFDNKLFALLPEEICIRHVINMGILELHNIIVNDRISMLIDLTGNCLRNSTLSFSLLNLNIVNFNNMLREYPLFIESKLYFKEVACSMEKDKYIAIIGDMKYITDEELLYIRKNYVNKVPIVFVCASFCELAFKKLFSQKLMTLGFTGSSFELKPIILPFKKYIDYISKAKLVLLTTGINMAQISEVLYCNIPVINLTKSYDNMFRENELVLKPRAMAINNFRLVFINQLTKLINKTLSVENKCFELYSDYYISLVENNKKYDIGYSCNGDIVIYSDLWE